MGQFYLTYNKNHIHLEQYVYKIASYHYNWHKDIELLIVLQGLVEVCFDGGICVLAPGDVILINSNKGHATLAKKPGSVAMLLHLDPKAFGEYYAHVDALHFHCQSGEESREAAPFVEIRACFADMLLSQRESAAGKLRFESALFTLLYTLALHFPPAQSPPASAAQLKKRMDAIEKMVKYIDKNYTRRITLEHLAKVGQYNRNYISQLFKSSLGINFYDYLTRVRLREATFALTKTDRAIADVALANGFSDVKAFNIAFKAMFGKTPTTYRKQLSLDITKEDAAFKKEFLSQADETVNRLLEGYLRDRDACRAQSLQLPCHAEEGREEAAAKAKNAALVLKENLRLLESALDMLGESST